MGKALILLTLGYSTIFITVLFNATSRQQRATDVIARQYEQIAARNAIESAGNVAVSKLMRGLAVDDTLTFDGADYAVSITDITGDLRYEVQKDSLSVVATYGTLSDTSAIVTMQPAYSYYQMFVHHWDSDLEFGDGDTLVGPIHLNDDHDQIRIRNSPVFLSKVTSEDPDIKDVGSADPKFYGGAEFGIDRITFPPSVTAIRDSAILGGVAYLGGNELWMRFFADGTYQCSTSVTVAVLDLADVNFNGAFYCDDHVYIQGGTVNGRITVHSAREVRIEDDIVYANDPTVDPMSDDYLALVAENKIRVENLTGLGVSTNNIHAALLSFGKFEVRDYSSIPPQGTMTIVGSMIVDDWEPVGDTDPNGYVLDLIHDPRFKTNTPPFFPRINRYEILYRSD